MFDRVFPCNGTLRCCASNECVCVRVVFFFISRVRDSHVLRASFSFALIFIQLGRLPLSTCEHVFDWKIQFSYYIVHVLEHDGNPYTQTENRLFYSLHIKPHRTRRHDFEHILFSHGHFCCRTFVAVLQTPQIERISVYMCVVLFLFSLLLFCVFTLMLAVVV